MSRWESTPLAAKRRSRLKPCLTHDHGKRQAVGMVGITLKPIAFGDAGGCFVDEREASLGDLGQAGSEQQLSRGDRLLEGADEVWSYADSRSEAGAGAWRRGPPSARHTGWRSRRHLPCRSGQHSPAAGRTRAGPATHQAAGLADEPSARYDDSAAVGLRRHDAGAPPHQHLIVRQCPVRLAIGEHRRVDLRPVVGQAGRRVLDRVAILGR